MLNLSAVTDDLDIATKEYVDTHGGGGGGASVELLWTNPNPLTAMSSLTINFTDEFDAYIITSTSTNEYNVLATEVIPAGITANLSAPHWDSGGVYRPVTTTRTSATFSSGPSSGQVIPYYIWGIKYSAGGSGSGGVSQIDLLWTNPNPTSNFAAQTLSNIPWQNYKFLFIDHYTIGNGNVADHYETSIISTANPSVWSWITCIREVPFARGVKFPASNQVQFGSQTYYSTYNGANATLYDDWPFIVPTKIWGVKDGGGTNPDVDWTQSTYAGGYYMRRGKMVSVVCESFGSITAPNNSYATVFTLPDGFRPILPTGKEMYGSCSPIGAAYPVTWKIDSDGKVSVGGCGTSPNYWAFSITFPCE